MSRLCVRLFVCVLITVDSVLGFQGFQRNVLDLPSTGSSSSRPMAWTSYNVIDTPLSRITLCVWIKSTDLSNTGSLFSYVTSDKTVEFSLTSYGESPLSTHSQQTYDIYLVVAGLKAPTPITLRVDDAVWHSVCAQWGTSGIWKIFLDQNLLTGGDDFQNGRQIRPGGRLYLGARHHYLNETKITNSDQSRPLIGKMVGLSIWNATLTAEDIQAVGDCKYFNTYQNAGWIFGDEGHDKDVSSIRKSLIYDWSEVSLTVTWPAGFYPMENVCENDITVDCTHDHMIISVSKHVATSLEIKQSHLHLIDGSCTPQTRGQRRERYVFDINDFSTCGTQRKVTETEVIYVNRVSNAPTKNLVVFVGRLYESEVRCHYPIDLTVSTRLFDVSQQNGLVFRTPMTHPKTNKQDLEAVVLLYQDEAFSKPYTDTPQLAPLDYLYVGVVVKNKMTQNPVENVNVVVDECWMKSNQRRKLIIAANGCWVISSSDVAVIENGVRPQARLKIYSRLISFSSGPVYLQCSIYPCFGKSCTPTCNPSNGSGLDSGNNIVSPMNKNNVIFSTSRRLIKRDASNMRRRHYKLEVGPIYTSGWDFNDNDKEHMKPTKGSEHFPGAGSFKVEPVILVIIVILSFVIFLSLFLVIAFLRKRRRTTDYSDSPEPVQVTRHKRHLSREPSVTSLSSMASTSSIGSLSSFDSFHYPTFSRYKQGKM
ncbi:unnamed protein product [Clavelina lepadiformis]|uniref:ZP domain-containing protein n=1 Tax=Clavelina lepadiformis TaxID=159417 RepID=A0ABP0FZR5_CLALP